MCKHHSERKAFIVPIIAILLLCLLSSSLPFGIHSRTASAADSVFYDFITQAPTASWSSGAGNLPFPGSDSDSRGFALYRNNWQLEDNITWAKVLETHPQWVSNGWILGRYPELTVPANAELKVTVGFFKGATASDGVTFEVKFEEFLGLQVAPKIYSILSHKATYDGKLDTLTEELSSLEGKTGNFVLYAKAGQSSGQDWAAWAEAKIEISSSDITPPQVTVTYSPSDVTTTSEVTFTVRARDESSITEIALFIDGEQVKECAPPSQGVDEKDRVYWECVYTGGPYEAGELHYWAEAVDEYSNRGTSPEGTINVALVVTPCWFSISGTIHNFPYPDETLRIKVCEAETIMAEMDGTTVPLTRCKEGGRIWYVETNRLMSGDLPGPDLTYRVDHLCPGEYVIAPEINEARAWCQWQGSWQTAKGQVVTIADSDAEGFDVTFTPLDTHSPEITSIRVEPEQPEYGDEITVTILASDDREIVGTWQKTDILGLDGSYHSDYWHSLTVVPGMEGSTAGAQFSFIVHNVMTATVTVRVCDTGGNSRMANKVIICGSCHDSAQNQGETGIDCGEPCPSQCVECLTEHSIGNAPSAYLYSPDDMVTVRAAAIDALFEYANEIGISVLDLDTGDPYGTTDNFIRAVSWWIPRHMGYRGDDLNRSCLDEVLPSPYEPGDYGHGDFPMPAAYTLSYSGLRYVTDASKDYFGDCEDFAILESAMLRSLGVCHNCIFNAEQPGHGFNIVYYEGKYRVLEPQSFAIGREDYGPEFIWNDKVGAYAASIFDKVRPWEYTMNYPGCENPTVSVTGGGFGGKTLWLDWADWGEYPEVAVGDFDDDGRDDIAAVYEDFWTTKFAATVFPSTGSGFQAPSEPLPRADSRHLPVMVGHGRRGDFLVVPEPHSGGYFVAVEGTVAYCPNPIRLWEPFSDADVICFGDPQGTGEDNVIEFTRGDTAEVRVGFTHEVWNDDFCPHEEIPLVGDFDGDGYDDVVSFERGDWAGVRVIRAVPDESKFTMLCLWNSEFCSGDEIPGVGDFNGDGRDDIVAFNQGNRDVFVGLSTVFGFWSNGFGETPSRWYDDFCSADDTPIVGDFNGDGLDDIACFRINNGRVRVWVALAMPSTLTYDYHSGNPCQQANFYLDAYWPSICP